MTGEVNDPTTLLAALLAKGHAARDGGDFAAAARAYGEAAERFPDNPEPQHHLGGAWRDLGRSDLAETAYARALQLAPGAPATARVLGVMLLEQGRYPEGFALLEARHLLPGMEKPALPFPEWRGEPLAGKRLVVWPEQGLGDQIMFVRFVPELVRHGAEVTLICRPGLERLFERSLGVTTLPAAGAVDFPDPDYWVMLGALPQRLGVTLQSLTGEPYLIPPPHPPRPPGGALRVGLKTAGNPAYSADAHRSLTPEAIAALRGLPAETVSLEPQDTGARDFDETAALVAGLDLVISVDTSVAHLAAAMGKPTWILLSAAMTDWRWLRGRTDSPWYRTVRLFRQAVADDWAEPIDAVHAALAEFRP